MLAVNLSHGAPPSADEPIWPAELAVWPASLPRLESILVVSARQDDAPVSVLQLPVPTLDRHQMRRLGRELAPLRDEMPLNVGTGRRRSAQLG
jgi:hypothetical protein